MRGINSRIEQLVSHFSKGNNSDFANKIGINEANIRNYISGTEPKFNVIEKIVKNFEINYEWLLTGKGEMLKSNKPIVSSTNNIENKVPQVVTVDAHNNDNIVLVPIQAQAGYLTGYDDPTFIEELPTYSLPGIRNGIFRMFQVKGLSMYPTLQNKSYVVGQFVDNWLTGISDNRVYVVVTHEHGVIVKRVLNRIEKYGNLYCKSDNRDYPNIPVSPEDIKEIWECKMQLSFEFLDPADVYNRLSELEADVLMLKDELKRKEQEK